MLRQIATGILVALLLTACAVRGSPSVIDFKNDKEAQAFTAHMDNALSAGLNTAVHKDGVTYFSRVVQVGALEALATGELYKRTADGTVTKLSDDVAVNLVLAGDKLYYINRSDGNTLYSMSLDGSHRKRLLDKGGLRQMTLSGATLYLLEDDALSRVALNGSGYQSVRGVALRDVHSVQNTLYGMDNTYLPPFEGGLVAIPVSALDEAFKNGLLKDVALYPSLRGTPFVLSNLTALYSKDGALVEAGLSDGSETALFNMAGTHYTWVDDALYTVTPKASGTSEITRITTAGREVLTTVAAGRFSSAGEVLLYTEPSGEVNALYPTGKIEQWCPPYALPSADDAEIVAERVEAIRTKVAFFDEQGYYQNGALNFNAVETIAEHYPQGTFDLSLGDEHTVAFETVLSGDSETLDIPIEGLVALDRVLGTFETQVAESPPFGAITDAELETAEALVAKLKDRVRTLEAEGLFLKDTFGNRVIDFTDFDETVLFEGIEGTAFEGLAPYRGNRSEWLLPFSELKILTRTGLYVDLDDLLRTPISKLEVRLKDLEYLVDSFETLMRLKASG